MKSHTYKRHPNCVVTEKLNGGKEVKRRGGEIFVKILLVPLSARNIHINNFIFIHLDFTIIFHTLNAFCF